MVNFGINNALAVNKVDKKPVKQVNITRANTETDAKSFDQTFGSARAFHPGQAQLFTKKVIVIDDKYQKLDADKKAKINGIKSNSPDNTPDVPHGEIVSSFISHETELKALDMNYKPVAENISTELQNVIDSPNANDIGSINLSVQLNYPIEKLAEYSGVEGLTPENLKEKAPAVVEGLRQAVAENLETENNYRNTDEYKNEKNAKQTKLMMAHQKLQNLQIDSPEYDKAYSEFASTYSDFKAMDKYQELNKIVQIHDQIDQLNEKGIPVCVSSGNSGGLDTEYVNLLTLNDKAITVGVRDAETGKVSSYSQNNSLVDVSFKSNTATNINGKVDINADGTGDIDVNKFSKAKSYLEQNPDQSAENLNFSIEVEGTSFTAPQAADLAAYMNEQGIKPEQMNNMFKQASEMIDSKPSMTVREALNQIISSK